MSSYFRQQLEQWLKTISVNGGRVVDIGGGSNPVKNRLNMFVAKEYKILDNRLEEAKNGTIDIDADLNDLYLSATDGGNEEYKKYMGNPIATGHFDIAFCLEVMEYISNPWAAIGNIATVLKIDGLLYISFPFVYPQHNPVTNDYLRYTKAGAIKLLTDAGFKIIECVARVQQGPARIQEWYASEKMHPAKQGVDHNDIGYLITAKKVTIKL